MYNPIQTQTTWRPAWVMHIYQHHADLRLNEQTYRSTEPVCSATVGIILRHHVPPCRGQVGNQ